MPKSLTLIFGSTPEGSQITITTERLQVKFFVAEEWRVGAFATFNWVIWTITGWFNFDPLDLWPNLPSPSKDARHKENVLLAERELGNS
jgi:hypothetical protein